MRYAQCTIPEDIMATFQYRARDMDGKAITGQLDGADKAAVAEQIIRLGYIPVEIKPEQDEKKTAKAKGARANWFDQLMRRVRPEEIIYFNRQLALVLGAGVTLLACLRIMANQSTNERLRQILAAISDDKYGKSWRGLGQT
jgi:type II secretory pathway component PulF